MRFFALTLGCKTNQSETDHIIELLLEKGHKYVDLKQSPDIVIINTCTVTSTTDKKTRQAIRKIKRIAGSGCRLIVTGCFVKYNRIFLEKQDVDDIIENSFKDKIPDLISKNEVAKGKEEETSEAKRYLLHARPFIKIQDGCCQNCAYCIVPKVRGPYRSENTKDIIERIKKMVSAGYEEAVLTGIHIGKYGIDSGSSLAGLLGQILSSTDIKRIRLSSLEANELSPGLMQFIKDNFAKIAPHFHIPLQSGSDKVLTEMSRPYTAALFEEKIRQLEDLSGDIAITTDIIVGFPTERKEDFENTSEMVKRLPFSKLHVFKFSPRKMTKAYGMEQKVDQNTKKKRAEELIGTGKEKRKKFLGKNLGKKLDVVIERYMDKQGLYSGTSGNYIKIYFGHDKNLLNDVGRLIKVRTDSFYLDGLKGYVD